MTRAERMERAYRRSAWLFWLLIAAYLVAVPFNLSHSTYDYIAFAAVAAACWRIGYRDGRSTQRERAL